ncbi:cold-shock DNA-binding domain protein [Candidatus Stoquefichus sp. KLE1796]|nr:cold-shock DNA-binding domain protein [Candidatus Stoquefichus sp. KLE1796]
MEKREPKDLTNYDKRFEEDPSSFNDFQAMDYVRELKNQGRNDEAIEVGRTFLQVGEGLTGFINHYGYALYNKFINIDENQISEKEDLFFSIVDEIAALCKQEKYSPLEATINKAMKYIMNKKPVDYKKISDLLDKLDVQTLSVDPFINNAGKEYESKKEKWYRLKVRCSYELGDYAKCVEYANNAFAQPIKWHYNNLNWVKYYRASSLVQLKRYEEAENEFLSLGNRIPNVDSFEVLYDLYMNTGKEKEAYTNLVYKFFTSGYNVQHLSLYEKILEMTHAGKNSEVAALADAFVYKVKEETGKDLTGASISDEYKDMNSSTLYDRFYNQLMENLDAYIERYEGKVVYYNKDKEFGSIYQDDDDNLFFRQADYIYDEVVEKRDVVEYSVMKTFDAKKQRPTTKAILLKTVI